jgi:hypothetical protein
MEPLQGNEAPPNRGDFMFPIEGFSSSVYLVYITQLCDIAGPTPVGAHPVYRE